MANPEIPEQAFPQIEISESNGSDLYLSEGVPIQDVLAGPVPPNPGITIREATLLETAGVKGIGEAVSIRPPDDVEKSDFDLLHERLDEVTRLVNHNNQMLQSFGPGMEYLCNSMGWLTNMLSGVAEVAQKMPGMGGMLARLAAPKGK